MFSSSPSDRGASVALGVILLVAITFILAILVLLLFQMPNIDMEVHNVPAIFQITKIRHLNEQGYKNYDSYVVVLNTATRDYKTRDLYAKTYRNGMLLNCAIPTLNGDDFAAKAHHYDVQHLVGAKGDTWYSGATIAIDYDDKTFYPGDIAELEVYDRNTQQIISRHSFKA
nr:hypothetical protein [uncultured Methanoregula sp.]